MTGIPYSYLYCLIAATFKTIPIVSTSFVGILGSMHCYFSYQDLKSSLIMACVYLYVDQRIAKDIFEKQVSLVDPTIVGMSVFLGLYAFGL